MRFLVPPVSDVHSVAAAYDSEVCDVPVLTFSRVHERIVEKFPSRPELRSRRHPELQAAATGRIEQLRDELRRQNRRAAGPFSHPLAARGPLKKLREHICDLSRLADAALLNAESAESHRIPTLTKDLQILLQTQQVWTDRLENQIWRLESQSMWQHQLCEVLSERPLSHQSILRVCTSLTRETLAMPSGAMLLPEPGLPATLSVPETLRGALGRFVEQIRYAVLLAGRLLPDVPAAEVAARMLQLSVMQPEFKAAIAAEDSATLAQAIEELGTIEFGDPSEQRIFAVTNQVLSTIDHASVSAADCLIPPLIQEFYSRACCSLVDANAADPCMMTVTMLRCLSLEAPHSCPDPASRENHPSATILTHKLRWHDGRSGNATAPKLRSSFSQTRNVPAILSLIGASDEEKNH
jgi:hypothetical protein